MLLKIYQQLSLTTYVGNLAIVFITLKLKFCLFDYLAIFNISKIALTKNIGKDYLQQVVI